MWPFSMTQLLLLAGLVVANPGPAWSVRGEGGTGAGWTEVRMEEAGRCPPADVCDVSSKEEVDEAFLLEVYVI